MREPNRPIQPAGPASVYKTYQLLQPVSSHFRPATCEEAECQAHLSGWRTAVDVSTDLGREQAVYIRRHSGRSFEVEQNGPLTTFVFGPGQTCFRAADHRVSLEREALHIVRRGDFRQLGTPTQLKPADWRDDMGEHLDRLANLRDRG
jgi:hypothetical protein